MASLTKRCRHGRATWSQCGCAWLIRYREGRRDRYISCGPVRSEAERMLALHRDTPRLLCEVARAPGLRLPAQAGVPWIYFVSGAHLTKIGTTTDLEGRLPTLQACSPVVLTLILVLAGGVDEERQLHARFDAFRRHGEWFALPIGWENEPLVAGVDGVAA